MRRVGRPTVGDEPRKLIAIRLDASLLRQNLFDQLEYRRHPLAGRSRSTDVSCEKNFFFSLFSSRTVGDLSVTRPCFLFMRCRTLVRTSHPSGSRHWKISKGEFFPPLASLLAPENCRYHAASNGSGLTDPVALPLRSPTPLWLTAWAYQPITTPASCL